MGRMRWGAVAAALVLVVAGCGDDDEDPDDAATATTTADDGGGDAASGELADYCEVATELDQSEDFPTAEQLERYQAVAPEEISDAVAAAAGPLSEADGDPVASFAAFADDDVEAAIGEINDFEQENCDIDHSDDGAPEGGDAVVDGDTEVDVVASEYTFEFGDIAAGPTSFVLTNSGEEAHFMIVSKLVDGKTIDDALASEGDPQEEGITEDPGGATGLAAPGGEDEEFLSVDLVPGNYVMMCFVSGPDGTPHAFMGMAVPFTVS